MFLKLCIEVLIDNYLINLQERIFSILELLQVSSFGSRKVSDRTYFVHLFWNCQIWVPRSGKIIILWVPSRIEQNSDIVCSKKEQCDVIKSYFWFHCSTQFIECFFRKWTAFQGQLLIWYNRCFMERSDRVLCFEIPSVGMGCTSFSWSFSFCNFKKFTLESSWIEVFF